MKNILKSTNIIKKSINNIFYSHHLIFIIIISIGYYLNNKYKIVERFGSNLCSNINYNMKGGIIKSCSKKSNKGRTGYENEGQRSLFFDNSTASECCDESYSTSGGFVCMTEEQKNLIYNRGNNATTDEYLGI